MSDRIAVVAAKRTPIGKFLGSLSTLSAVELGIHAARATLAAGAVDPESIDEIIFGHARQAGSGPNPARQVSMRAGVPQEAPAMTVNQACASGLQAIILGAQRIRWGEAQTVLVGGMESMSRVPFMLPQARTGYRMGHNQVVDGMYRDGFDCPLAGQLMGVTAETLAEKYSIPRQEQDAFAAHSQHKTEAAGERNAFVDEIAPITVAGRKGDTLVDRDEHPRNGVTVEQLGKLTPVFRRDGTVTAGNSSGITDGAAALVLTTEALAKERGQEPLAFVEAGVTTGVDPKIMGIGPVPAVRKLAERTGRSLDGYDLIELNEAFAAQMLAVDRELHLNAERLNVNGGAIALGHPIGATGSRIAVTLLHEMRRRESGAGLATLCVSGGLGIAVSFIRR